MENSYETKDVIILTNEKIKTLRESILSLNSACITFINNYDNYNFSNMYDASLMKEKMKNALIRVVKDDV